MAKLTMPSCLFATITERKPLSYMIRHDPFMALTGTNFVEYGLDIFRNKSNILIQYGSKVQAYANAI